MKLNSGSVITHNRQSKKDFSFFVKAYLIYLEKSQQNKYNLSLLEKAADEATYWENLYGSYFC